MATNFPRRFVWPNESPLNEFSLIMKEKQISMLLKQMARYCWLANLLWVPQPTKDGGHHLTLVWPERTRGCLFQLFRADSKKSD